MVKAEVGPDVEIVTTPTDDLRSYRVSSELIQKELGFSAQYTVQDAVQGLVEAFQKGLAPNSMTDPRYYNIKVMQQLNIK